MDLSNKTVNDAWNRVYLGKVGSLANPTEKYLDKLELEVAKWLEEIKEERFKRFNARTKR